MAQNRVLSMIGLAQKAGKTASGEFATEHAVKSGKAALVIVSEESSDNKKRSSKICVTTTKYPCISMVEKRSWATRWARNSARPWRFWMRDLRRA